MTGTHQTWETAIENRFHEDSLTKMLDQSSINTVSTTFNLVFSHTVNFTVLYRLKTDSVAR